MSALNALRGIDAQGFDAEVDFRELDHVAHGAVDNNARPAVLRRFRRDDVTDQGDLGRALAVDDGDGAFARFVHQRSKQLIIVAALHRTNSAGELLPATKITKLC